MMRVPYSWLLDFIDPDLSPEALADRFTMAGVEVGAVETFGQPLPGVVVGEVKSIEAHPGKSNLTLVETDVGEKVLNIVCGAKNLKVGDRVPTARPGAELPGGRKIDEAVIHGARSSGMLCSAQELGLELGSEDEILILDGSAAIGEPADRVLGFGDKILHLELTPNRADCLSLLGAAYETAALTGKEVTMPPLTPVEAGKNIDEVIEVTVQDTELCPRYSARAVGDIKIGAAPLWMQLRLLKAGVRPINNVVDITNYVMWEFGQPLHAFDLDLLKEKRIIVRRARDGEKLVTLDGFERILNSEALVITDGTEPVGLAGVMGGENTEITASTSTVLIEAASFNPTNIRRTARRYNLPSEASQRFEKGVNPEAVLWSQDRAARLINELSGGKVLKGVIDQYVSVYEPERITVRPERVNKILGLSIPGEEMTALLSRLGFSVQQKEGGEMAVTVPLRRADVRLEEDIVEEVARLHGYDKVPITLPRGEMIENRESIKERLERLARNTMTACGFYECITYSFINPANLHRMRLPEDDPRMQTIPVQNPFSEEQAVMRTTVIPGLLKTVQHNCSHRELNQLLFEIGSVYIPQSLPLEELPEEKVMLGLAATGLIPEPNWIDPSREADFFTVKGALEALFSRLQIGLVEFVPAVLPFAHPTRCARIFTGGEELGFLGQLHPEVAEQFAIDQAVTVCELDLALLCGKANLVPRVAPLPRYPSANRDIAVVVSREIPAQRLEEAIRQAGEGLVAGIKLFDLYEGRQIPEGKRSLAFSITFRREEGTLTDDEVNLIQDKIEKALNKLGAVLRR